MIKYIVKLLNKKNTHKLAMILSIAYVCNMIAACDDSKKVYTYKSEAPNTTETVSKDTEKSHTLIWDTPKGWKEEKPEYTMQTAVFSVADDKNMSKSSEPAIASITILNGSGGGVFQNVNRWRQQVGLEPIQDENILLASAKKINGTLGSIKWYSILENSSKKGIFAAIIPNQTTTIFVKLIGPVKVLKNNERKFIDFVSSIRAATNI